jgi:hypothetical protein
MIQHEWPSGAQFVFKCYRHWGMLVIQGKGGAMFLLYSKEEVMQGDPLSMFAYGIGIMPLIQLSIPDPSATSEDNFEASTLGCSHLLAAFRGVEPFSSMEHRSFIAAELKVRRSAQLESTLESVLGKLDCAFHAH